MAFPDGYLSEEVLQRDTSPPPHLNLETLLFEWWYHGRTHTSICGPKRASPFGSAIR